MINLKKINCFIVVLNECIFNEFFFFFQLRKYGKELVEMVQEKASDSDIENKILEQMSHIYRVIGICLGIPPETFTWEYTNKSKVTLSIGPVTPLEFYNTHVKPIFNMDDKVV